MPPTRRSTLRELGIPLGTTGSVLHFDIRSPERVLVIGARHQQLLVTVRFRAAQFSSQHDSDVI